MRAAPQVREAARNTLIVRRTMRAIAAKTQPRARRMNLREFIREAWPILEPRKFEYNWHIDAIADHLEAVARGRIKNLVINIPPGFGKSIIVCAFFPAWIWAEVDATARMIFASYNELFARRDSRRTRDILRSRWWDENYSQYVQIHPERDGEMQFETYQSGVRLATSITGSGTGSRADFIIADDPHKMEEVDSPAARRAVINWWQSTMSTRDADPRTAKRIVVMQRLHPHDLSGWCLENGYEHLAIPMRFSRKFTEKQKPSQIGWRDPRENEGQPVWPDRFTDARETELRSALGIRAYAQLDQEPRPAEGAIIKHAWFRYWVPSEGSIDEFPEISESREKISTLPSRMDFVVDSWDYAFAKSVASSYVAGVKIGRCDGNFYLLGLIRRRMQFTEMVDATLDLSRAQPAPDAVLMEMKANGEAVRDTLRARVPGIIGIVPRESKLARLNAVSPIIEAGNFFVPHPKLFPWVGEYIDELESFTGDGGDDDQVDATSQALVYLRENYYGMDGAPVFRAPQTDGWLNGFRY